MQYVYTHMSPKLYLNELALVNLDFKVRLFFTAIHALYNFILYLVLLFHIPSLRFEWVKTAH
jgi:hypothetical protein